MDQSKQQWIPVSERLPETNGSYFCWFADGFYGIYDWDEFSSKGLWRYVTHWMPLPVPPMEVT